MFFFNDDAISFSGTHFNGDRVLKNLAVVGITPIATDALRSSFAGIRIVVSFGRPVVTFRVVWIASIMWCYVCTITFIVSLNVSVSRSKRGCDGK